MDNFFKNLLPFIILCVITLLLTVIILCILNLNVGSDGFFYWWVLITIVFVAIFGFGG